MCTNRRNPRDPRGKPRFAAEQLPRRSRGLYILAVEAHGEIEVGRLGPQRFDGLYLYVGSALGSGGLRRVERHRTVASGKSKTRHWHVDYLLALGELTRIFVRKTNKKLECVLAQELEKHFEPTVRGFGSSDCRCRTHLFKASGPWEHLVLKTMRGLAARRAR